MVNQISSATPEFWGQIAKKYLNWFQPWETLQSGDFDNLPVEWFVNGRLNACYNCIDRHLPQYANHTAILWEGNELHQHQTITYAELYKNTCRMANLLKKYGVGKSDVVCIYLPMIPEAIYSILACSRIGAVHNVIFGGFSSDALANRINNSKAKFVITSNQSPRGEKIIDFKKNIDLALNACPDVEHVMIIEHLKATTPILHPRDFWYHEHIQDMSSDCSVEWMKSQDPLFILYTSGSTGQPKGIVHSTGGYLSYVAYTFDIIFQQKNQHPIHWCTADIGWITGHSYLIYGPLLHATTTVMYEGVPHYPDFSRYWQIIDKYQIQNFYTAPTVLRALRHEGDDWIRPFSLKSLQILGSVGEPINPEVWTWYFNRIGQKRCPIVNTWWQTETGGVLIYSRPEHLDASPGSAGLPVKGIEVCMDSEHMLYVKKPWPGMMKTIFNDFSRFQSQYFNNSEHAYFTGDSASLNPQKEYIMNGRMDDVMKVSGHRLGSEELESAVISHHGVSESAVVGIPHPIKGEAIVIFAVPFEKNRLTTNFTEEIKTNLRQKIGPVASPERIIWVPGLPKTRSGKIMRRLLRKLLLQEYDSLGDISTLANPEIIDQIIHAMNNICLF